ncbi:3-(methylthio)propionyl-CoA ligase [Pelagibius sp. Alg239-R121]|uniref:3-(methylthio)propionyl-CoA ligase n=1 Tax=Pelagibius sp. Alg239-R121 TaxID=2993448 RepID=UPI0024A67AAB|nr:3-(methylthio)propionyl-CoA ligase [Pelagibius sp. Alg239-R121]
MLGLMMGKPLLISSLLRHGAEVYAEQEIVSRRVEGDLHRYSYAEAHQRAQRLANVLNKFGIERGDRIATLAWNGYRHFEIYYGVSGFGAVCHTVNPRLHPSQIAYILNHAEDRYLFVDLTFMPLIEAVHGQLETVRGIVVLTDRAHMPDSKIPGLLCYEELLEQVSETFDWPEFDENTASSLCYTSGTTGNPKGVLYSHRSTVLHSLIIALPEVMNFSEKAAVLPVVPMFHVNAWGIPYATPFTGTKLVNPGPKLDGDSLWDLMESEGVTASAGVPTIWLDLLRAMRDHGRAPKKLEFVVIGGAAVPKSMVEAFEKDFGVEVRQGWGMTETSPVGTINVVKQRQRSLPDDDRYELQTKQGRKLFGVDLKIVDEDGTALPHDGEAQGELKISGPWVCKAYFKQDDDNAHREDGWFSTGDVATIDPNGYMQITDRVKDMIKSGGEWISSIDLENAATGHPSVAMAAVIGVAHQKWDERPLLLVVPRPEAEPDSESIRAYLSDQVAKWWLPDDIIFVESLPLGATGKILKNRLREEYKNHLLDDS